MPAMNKKSAWPAALPIVQAPMAGVQDSRLAIAVARAGGVGSVPCALLTPEGLEREVTILRDSKVSVYNLNFFCHRTPEPCPAREAAWRDALKPYYAEFGLDPEAPVSGPERTPFSAECLEVLRPFAPPIVSFHFGLPRAEWVETIRAWGGAVWSSATTVDEARWLETRGVDAVIAQGIEAGGHRGMFLAEDLTGQANTRTLLKDVLEAVTVPVIAAGGIASPAHVAAYLRSGAVAVQVGTAYLLCDEALTTPVHRRALGRAGAGATEVTRLLSGRPARGIRNRLMAELEPQGEKIPAFPRAALALGPLRRAAEQQGRDDFSPLWCGTDPSGCRSVGAADQTRWLASAALPSP